MAQEKFTREQFFAELDALGLLKVREKHAVGAWGQVGPKVKLVELYIAEHDRAAAAVESEQTRIAREAKDAAQRSADAAERSANTSDRSAAAAERSANTAEAATRRATLALLVAAASIIVQVILALVRPA
jgi:CHASE3 domain sensor protein